MIDKEIIAIVQAHIEGKQIQYYNDNEHEWRDCANNKPCWEFSTTKYRVKPESKVRPYKDREECWNDIQKHEPFGWIKAKDNGNYIYLTSISNDRSFNFAFEKYTYVDGSPFGVIEEE